VNPHTERRVAALEVRAAPTSIWPETRTLAFEEIEAERAGDDRLGRILARVLPAVPREWFEAQRWATLGEQLDAIRAHAGTDFADCCDARGRRESDHAGR